MVVVGIHLVLDFSQFGSDGSQMFYVRILFVSLLFDI